MPQVTNQPAWPQVTNMIILTKRCPHDHRSAISKVTKMIVSPKGPPPGHDQPGTIRKGAPFLMMMFIVQVLTATCCRTAASSRPWRGSNVSSLKGRSLNGRSLNDHSLNSRSLNGRSLINHSLNSRSLNDHSWNDPAAASTEGSRP